MSKYEKYDKNIMRILKREKQLSKTSAGYGSISFTEKKFGYTPYDEESDWYGNTSFGPSQKKDIILDKKIKRIANSLIDKFEIPEKYKVEVKDIILSRIWGYHKKGKKREDWDDENKRKKRLSYSKPTLMGVGLKTNILAVIFDILTNRRIALYNDLLQRLDKNLILQADYSRIKKLIRQISKALNLIEKEPEFPEARRRFKKLCQEVYKAGYYDIQKIDKIFNKYKEEGFSSLFKLHPKKELGTGLASIVREALIESHKLAEFKKKKMEEERKKNEEALEWYYMQVGVKGQRLAIRLIQNSELKEKNKARKGLAIACSYLIAKLNYIDGYWIAPKKSISAWAKFCGMDRKVFRERTNDIKKSKGYIDYIKFRINFL